MGARRLAVALLVAASSLAACGGDDDSAGVAVEEPIGAPESPGYDGGPTAGPAPATAVSKTGLVAMEVPKGELTDAAQRVVDVATARDAGGFLVSSVLDLESGYGSGSILVKVPAATFESTIVELAAIGDVTRQEMSGQDLTPDALAARDEVRRAKVQAAVLARRLERTDDAAARSVLLDRLRDARASLTEAAGEEDYVRSETAYSPIEVALSGRRPSPPPPATPVERSLGTAKDIALGIASGAIVAAGALVPAGVIALAIYVVWSVVMRRLRLRWESFGGSPTP